MLKTLFYSGYQEAKPRGGWTDPLAPSERGSKLGMLVLLRYSLPPMVNKIYHRIQKVAETFSVDIQ
jgi:hypothetical protein